ncbi:MAG: hypothetical protein ABI591_06840 [Kofleriaceae bacterium]
MKFLLLGLVFSTACAGSQPTYVNVASVRHDISDTIAHDPAQRKIVSMGHTTNESAVVFTQASTDAPKREETWVKDGGGWKMKEAKDLANM